MNCTSCRTNLPSGVSFCPNCGTVVAAAQGPGANPYDATFQQQMPSTGYGASPYETSGSNPYGAITPAPYSQTPYSASQQSLYGAPPPPPTYPPAGSPGTFVSQPAPTPKSNNRLGLIIGIVALVLILVGGGVFAVIQLTKNPVAVVPTPIATTAPTAIPSPTPTPSPTTPPASTVGPSGSPVVPSATGFLTNVQLASAVDSTTLLPTQFATSFAVNQNVYLTFTANLQNQSGGYAIAKWYVDGVFGKANMVLSLPTNGPGYFTLYYKIPANGAVELYWCQQSNCSDAQLVALKTFTIHS